MSIGALPPLNQVNHTWLGDRTSVCGLIGAGLFLGGIVGGEVLSANVLDIDPKQHPALEMAISGATALVPTGVFIGVAASLNSMKIKRFARALEHAIPPSVTPNFEPLRAQTLSELDALVAHRSGTELVDVDLAVWGRLHASVSLLRIAGL
jgi:hypothetical protein